MNLSAIRIKKTNRPVAACLFAAIAFLTSCGADNVVNPEDVASETTHTYHIAAEANSADNLIPGTRALIDENGTSEWLLNDELIAYNLSDNDKSAETSYSLLKSEKRGKVSHFIGELKSANAIKQTDEICFFYPGASSVGEGRTITPVASKTYNNEQGKALVYHKQQSTIKQLVELNMTKQDGSINTIGRKYDYQWTKVQPLSVNGNNVHVKIGTLKHQVAVWGLRFADDKDNVIMNVDEVTISNVKSADIFNLKEGKFVDNNPKDEKTTIEVLPAMGKKFNTSKEQYVYVALIPGEFKDVSVSVKVGTKVYKRTYNTLKFDAKLYHSNILRMK